jgi:hypothetical protein
VFEKVVDVHLWPPQLQFPVALHGVIVSLLTSAICIAVE